MPFLRPLFAAAFCAAFSALPLAAQAGPQCAPLPQAKAQSLRAARQGVFQYLRMAEEPIYLGDLRFQDAQGHEKSLADFSGKTLLVNLWGVWCPPCRAEIKDLSDLQQSMGGKNFAVLTIHDQGSRPEKVRAFLAEQGAENLPLYRDADMELYSSLKRQGLARGLPVSLLVDKNSCLIASLNGGAPWNAEEARHFIRAAELP